MDSTRFRRWWRMWFYAAVVIAGPFTVPSALDRPDAERIAHTAGWVAVALVYAALAWRTRGNGPVVGWQDVMTVGMFLLAALYEANWPDFRIALLPSAIGGIWAAAVLGSSYGASKRWMPPEGTGAGAGGGTPLNPTRGEGPARGR